MCVCVCVCVCVCYGRADADKRSLVESMLCARNRLYCCIVNIQDPALPGRTVCGQQVALAASSDWSDRHREADEHQADEIQDASCRDSVRPRIRSLQFECVSGPLWKNYSASFPASDKYTTQGRTKWRNPGAGVALTFEKLRIDLANVQHGKKLRKQPSRKGNNKRRLT